MPKKTKRETAGLLLLGIALALLTACAGQEPSTDRGPDGAADAKRLTAVLVAGDDSSPAFDNAIDYLADTLAGAGVPTGQIHRLSAARLHAVTTEPATNGTILARLRQMAPPPGGSCLVYLTSHGIKDYGLYLRASPEALSPKALDQALSVGCGEAPTVVVVSACFAGQFTKAPMARKNRIILAAADPSRTSFGCGTNFAFTYFDECLLGALGEAPFWSDVFDRARHCVAQREQQIYATPSEPVAAFGADVVRLGPPAPPSDEAATNNIHFLGAQRFDPSRLPVPPIELHRLRGSLERYGAAGTPKALAMTAEGLLVSATAERNPLRSAADVARLALQRCEWLTGGACILYARDDRSVGLLASGLAPFHPPRLIRSGPLTPASVPFIRDDQRSTILAYLAAPGPKALALNPDQEEIGIGHGRTIADARADAIGQCRVHQHDCVIYAEDDQIVLGWPSF